MNMKKFKIGSYQLTETKKWAPCGTLFEFIEGDKMKITEADVFPPEYRFQESYPSLQVGEIWYSVTNVTTHKKAT